MRYVLLAYRNPQQVEAMPANEGADFEAACLASNALLREQGYLYAMEELPSRHSTTTICLESDALSISEGTYAAAQEQLVGFYFINACDLNEAIQVAAQMPQLRRGAMEVRPISESMHLA